MGGRGCAVKSGVRAQPGGRGVAGAVTSASTDVRAGRIPDPSTRMQTFTAANAGTRFGELAD